MHRNSLVLEIVPSARRWIFNYFAPNRVALAVLAFFCCSSLSAAQSLAQTPIIGTPPGLVPELVFGRAIKVGFFQVVNIPDHVRQVTVTNQTFETLHGITELKRQTQKVIEFDTDGRKQRITNYVSADSDIQKKNQSARTSFEYTVTSKMTKVSSLIFLGRSETPSIKEVLLLDELGRAVSLEKSYTNDPEPQSRLEWTHDESANVVTELRYERDDLEEGLSASIRLRSRKTLLQDGSLLDAVYYDIDGHKEAITKHTFKDERLTLTERWEVEGGEIELIESTTVSVSEDEEGRFAISQHFNLKTGKLEAYSMRELFEGMPQTETLGAWSRVEVFEESTIPNKELRADKDEFGNLISSTFLEVEFEPAKDGMFTAKMVPRSVTEYRYADGILVSIEKSKYEPPLGVSNPILEETFRIETHE